MAEQRTFERAPRMVPLFARAGAALIPGASRLPFVGVGARGEEVPDLILALEDVAIDPERLAAYDRVCGFGLGDAVPATYPHILAFPLHLALMTDPSFPLAAIGLVHIANEITQHRPILVREKLSLKVWATPLEPHPRGTQFSLRTEARVGEEVVWEEVSTNLRRGRSSDAPSQEDRGGQEDDRQERDDELPATATWKLPGDLGRRYGQVSGDLNPIHMHSLSARLFGFPSAIAHGMWTKARCLAALEPRTAPKFTVRAAFKKPIRLPATVQFAEHAEPGIVRFAVRDAKKAIPHLDGELSSG